MATQRTITMNIRLPGDVRAKLEALAERDRRSLNAEIIWLIEAAALETPGDTPGK